MNDVPILLLAGSCGLVLGGAFFGGLWWTVRRGLASPYPAAWFLASLVARTGLAVEGFYVVGGGHWQRMAACLVGFVGGRFVVTRITAYGGGRPPREARHAAQP
ncbi:MAG: ATPase, subunit 2 [Phycisphaerales bacterium]|nr:ATPase, subunit 2 [Phycisphaerales bacterium]